MDDDAGRYSVEEIDALPLADRAGAYARLLEDLKRDLEADGRQ
ncbi:hypothetical protein [Herbiconiux sp. L3-i23]|nr:hypothetical protein [Herbiconiux sp. L3-i23]